MKLHLPLNLLAALMTSFSGVTLGTATLAGVSGLLVTASQSYAADVAFDGTQVNVAAGGSASYDVGTVTASTTLNFAGAGTAAITNLNGTAPEAILTVNRVASGGASLSTLTLNGAGTFNGIISLYSNTTGGSQNNILNLNHAQAAQYATIKLGGYGYTTGASVLKAGVNTSISKLEHNNAAALITGEGTTLTITGDSSSYGGSFGGTVTVDYTGGGTFTLGNSDKNTALSPAASPNATLKISRGTLSLFSGNVTWSQKLVMGDGTTLNIQDGPPVTGAASYNAASINSGGFNFSGAVTLGSGVNLTSSWGKNVKFSGVLTAASGFPSAAARMNIPITTCSTPPMKLGDDCHYAQLCLSGHRCFRLPWDCRRYYFGQLPVPDLLRHCGGCGGCHWQFHHRGRQLRRPVGLGASFRERGAYGNLYRQFRRRPLQGRFH